MLVGLYTSRVVLKALGVSDFGIYNVIGGLVAMFSIISSSLTTAISRYITVTLGLGDEKRLSDVFSTSIIVQSILAFIIIILGEIIGVWFLNTQMNIPDNRMVAANWVFQFSIFSFAINLISIPYNACIIAHERMSAFAYISILEASLKLLIVYLLVLSSVDKLITYSFLLLVVAILVRLVYSIYSKKNFEECYFHFLWDKDLIKEMLSFAGWSFIGNTAGILRNQGGNILLNIYGGTIVNAAAGIANQVNNSITGFSNNFIMAVNPQIMKLYSQEKLDRACHLVRHSSRLAFMMMLVITTPIIIITPDILKIWLTTVPAFSVNFVRLILILSLIECTCVPLITLNQATGKIRNYQLVVGFIHLLNFPLSWWLLSKGALMEIVYFVAIALALVNLYARLIMLNRMLGFSIWEFTRQVVFKMVATSMSCYTLIALFFYYISSRSFLLFSFSLTVSMFVVWTIGMRSVERSLFVDKILKLRK